MVKKNLSRQIFFFFFDSYINIEAAPDACAAEAITDYNMSLRVGALFIILATSALGKLNQPPLITSFFSYSQSFFKVSSLLSLCTEYPLMTREVIENGY